MIVVYCIVKTLICWRYHSEEGINYSSFRKQPLVFRAIPTLLNQISSLQQFPSPWSNDLWWFSSSTMDFPGPAAPRPKGPKRTRVPPRSEWTKNECNWKTRRIVRNQTYNTNDWKKCNLQLNELNSFWFFFSIWTATCVWIEMARSTSRKEATANMRFKGQVTGDVNLLDQTMTS